VSVARRQFARAIPAPQRGTRLELVDPYLGKVRLQSEYARTRKWPCGAYFPAGSMLFDTESRRVTSSDDDLT